jgi:4-hydroxy-3-polyprenylbenzoate decarboxylase
MKHIILAMTGASGSAFGLEALRQLNSYRDVRTHLIISGWAEQIMKEETGRDCEQHIRDLDADRIRIHAHGDMNSPLASGSNPIHGMLISPCSMGTLCSIASGLSANLIERSASVCLKERRRLILMARETPLSTIHLEQMAALSRSGAVIMPPVPAMYSRPENLEQMISQIISRSLMLLDIDNTHVQGWNNETL